MSDAPQPWEQQPDERPDHYEQFLAYRDQPRGERSLRRLAKQLDRGDHAKLGRVASRHAWVARVAAYDRHLDNIRQREIEEKVKAMGRRQATQLEAATSALTQPIEALLRRVAEHRGRGQDPFAGIPTKELARIAAAAANHLPRLVEAERLVAGLSTQNVNPDAPGSPDEARRRAEQASRSELEAYLLGIDDGRRTQLDELGIPDSELLGDPPAPA